MYIKQTLSNYINIGSDLKILNHKEINDTRRKDM